MLGNTDSVNTTLMWVTLQRFWLKYFDECNLAFAFFLMMIRVTNVTGSFTFVPEDKYLQTEYLNSGFAILYFSGQVWSGLIVK